MSDLAAARSIDRFAALATADAPGQELRQAAGNIGNLMRGGRISGRAVDFSHGDVDAFAPAPGASDHFSEALAAGGRQAYTEYRGSADIRVELSEALAAYTGAPVAADSGTIITPGTQGALFLAVAALVNSGDKVAIVQPDYFANRKLVEFFGGHQLPVTMDYLRGSEEAGLDLAQLKAAFEAGARLFLFSNPNNPTGAVYSRREIHEIAQLAAAFDVTIVADQLYSRLLYTNQSYAHMRAAGLPEERVITIMGPSKTESLSGYRLGIAFGAPAVIERMERLQAIVSLRAAGYNQAVLRTWFREPAGWLDERIQAHQAIRDDLLDVFRAADLTTRTPQAGSYLFPTLPPLAVELGDFVRLLRRQADVIVTPGTEFGPCPCSIRLNFSQDHAAAVAAARRIVEMVHRYRR
ncbi:pyridoxal phosphate-dependent aminotransferase [Bradyrhizobium arachidis]|uniref:aspartate transaminase n=1 Tax=Bradyrhizobium arachidis TaxID=858423 RepID=A0AAE7NHE5_9BRAD|nr:pyridoxal phosphate-dependent aminotransferase [Bradyrhizobium arachidis]QOZ66119.1 pyridoxal phosphate-dependent aminotransferase [Bradyrhizobium arachidis]SFV04576.1 Aspartate/methionine/tyrosine aminotransferase [Bradyrhizobium arachidis]